MNHHMKTNNSDNIQYATILKRYYKDSHEKALRLVTDDEYVGITFDNLYKIKNLIKIYEKNG